MEKIEEKINQLHGSKIAKVNNRQYYIFVGIIALLLLMMGFLVVNLMIVTNKNVNYMVHTDGTYAVYKTNNNKLREYFEVENFAKEWINKTFNNNIYTYGKNMEKVLSVMNLKSGLLLRVNFNKQKIKETLQDFNGQMYVEKVDVISVDTTKYPYEVTFFSL